MSELSEESSPPISIDSSSWTTADSSTLYRINNWGAPYFDITEKGEVAAVISGTNGESETHLSIHEIVKELENRGIPLPAIVRFPNILSSRIALPGGARVVSVVSGGNVDLATLAETFGRQEQPA